MSADHKPVIVGSRGSALALAQTRAILRELEAAHPELRFEIKIIKTTGDHLSEINSPDLPSGKGIFTAEIEYALLRGDIDLAVHSLKDLPVEMRSDLAVGAIPKRADARDVLVTRTPIRSLDEVPQNAIIATGSPRRASQLRLFRPAAKIVGVRGNIDTRLRKLRETQEWFGIVLAKAGLDRLQPDIRQLTLTPFPLSVMLPAPGQGALALQIRAGDEYHHAVLQKVHDPATAACVRAERAFLSGLGGGCQAPVAASATVEGSTLKLRGVAWIDNASNASSGEVSGPTSEATQLGKALAGALLQKP